MDDTDCPAVTASIPKTSPHLWVLKKRAAGFVFAEGDGWNGTVLLQDVAGLVDSGDFIFS